jgi:hypothetical protein
VVSLGVGLVRAAGLGLLPGCVLAVSRRNASPPAKVTRGAFCAAAVQTLILHFAGCWVLVIWATFVSRRCLPDACTFLFLIWAVGVSSSGRVPTCSALHSRSSPARLGCRAVPAPLRPLARVFGRPRWTSPRALPCWAALRRARAHAPPHRRGLRVAPFPHPPCAFTATLGCSFPCPRLPAASARRAAPPLVLLRCALLAAVLFPDACRGLDPQSSCNCASTTPAPECASPLRTCACFLGPSHQLLFRASTRTSHAPSALCQPCAAAKPRAHGSAPYFPGHARTQAL